MRLAGLRCSSLAWLLLSSRETLGGYAGGGGAEINWSAAERAPKTGSVLSRCDGREVPLQRKRLADNRAIDDDDNSGEQRRINEIRLVCASIRFRSLFSLFHHDTVIFPSSRCFLPSIERV